MTPKHKTSELIRQMEFQPGQAMQNRMISSIRTAQAQQPCRRTSLKVYALAAAAIILVLISFVLNTPRRHSAPGMHLTLTPTNMLSMRSMQLAFRNDGLDGLEEHLDASLTQVGPRPTDMLMQGFYENVDL
ncbi:MAG: hypothetical protein K9N55_17465 [Phycisphaerae bacterium]|nr:hypothetical protein [Phycisphaerae bacterium]